MEFFLENRILSILSFNNFHIIYKIWKDLEFKGILNKKIEDLSANSLNNSKEIESLLIEIGETTKRIEFVLEYQRD